MQWTMGYNNWKHIIIVFDVNDNDYQNKHVSV